MRHWVGKHGGCILKMARAYPQPRIAGTLTRAILLQILALPAAASGPGQPLHLALPRGAEHRDGLATP